MSFAAHLSPAGRATAMRPAKIPNGTVKKWSKRPWDACFMSNLFIWYWYDLSMDFNFFLVTLFLPLAAVSCISVFIFPIDEERIWEWHQCVLLLFPIQTLFVFNNSAILFTLEPMSTIVVLQQPRSFATRIWPIWKKELF